MARWEVWHLTMNFYAEIYSLKLFSWRTMSLNSLDHILDLVVNQPGWEAQRQFHLLLKSWQEVVEPKIALQTRPLYVARKVLWIATANSVWAQTLTLQRYSLLKKLNQKISPPLTDLRFSTAKWPQQLAIIPSSSDYQVTNNQKHPSLISPLIPRVKTNKTNLPQLPLGQDPQGAFQRWAQALEQRSQSCSFCPQCQSPTPEGELKRWQVCIHCVSQQWNRE